MSATDRFQEPDRDPRWGADATEEERIETLEQRATNAETAVVRLNELLTQTQERIAALERALTVSDGGLLSARTVEERLALAGLRTDRRRP